jgi:hypothetical protein
MPILPNVVPRRSNDGTVLHRAVAATMLVLANAIVGCSSTSRLPDAGAGSIAIPVRFVTLSGEAILPDERPTSVTAWFSAISGEIYGYMRDPFITEPIDTVPALSINLDQLQAKFRDMAKTITADALASGWTIDPADTRFFSISLGSRGWPTAAGRAAPKGWSPS